MQYAGGKTLLAGARERRYKWEAPVAEVNTMSHKETGREERGDIQVIEL